MSQYISNNDDDLFEYDPTEENEDSLLKKYVEQQYDYVNSEKDLHQKYIGSNALAKTLSETFDKENDLDSITLSNASVYRALMNAMETFVITDRDNNKKTVHKILDELTQGKFSLMLMYNVLEERIAVRRILYLTLQAVFKDKSSKEIESFISLASKFSHAEITDEFLTGSIRTTISILDFTIKLDQVNYLHVAEKLNEPIKEVLFKTDEEFYELQLQTLLFEGSYTHYLQRIEEKMFAAFSLPVKDGSENEPKKMNIIDRLSQQFEKEVRYIYKDSK